MIGFKTTFVNLTRGEGLAARSFLGYEPYRGPIQGVRKGEWEGGEEREGGVNENEGE
jgi:predicted membrane GTPase involved in stress response